MKFHDIDLIINQIIHPPASISNTCNCGKLISALGPDGRVYPCMNFVGDIDYSFGFISDISLVNIRNSNFAKQLSGTDKIKECKKCKFRWLCFGGCKDRVRLSYKRFDRPDPYCKFLKWLFKKLLFKTVDLMGENINVNSQN